MNTRSLLIIGYILLIPHLSDAQSEVEKKFTKADTLRGSITPERAWWDLLHYSIEVQPDLIEKTIKGSVVISFKAIQEGNRLQIDLQKPLVIDSVLVLSRNKKQQLTFSHENNAAFIQLNSIMHKGEKKAIKVFYHGVPREAVRPPWDGGISWKKDKSGAPFVATSCQGLGASVWWPCKDHQYDEPDSGMIISVRIPDTLVEVSNGRLKNVINHKDRTKTWVWEVKNPINNYSVSMNIGKYSLIKDSFSGEGGKLSLQYYVLSSSKDSALKQLKQVKPMIKCFEHWFGKYPFYEDGYKLVEVPYLGMEHQSNVAYGNRYQNGYLGRDLSGTGWGLNWDFIIIHESGHEWFGNNITSNDIADMWIHEGFTNYSETLFTECLNGVDAGNEYNYGSRKNIRNDKPIIAPYHVQASGSGDMYPKASAMIHSIRQTMNDDQKFREMLRYLNKKFYHANVNTEDIEKVMSSFAGYSLVPVFDQYLRNTTVPVLEYYVTVSKDRLVFRYTNAIPQFNLPLLVQTSSREFIKILPKTTDWQYISLKPGQDQQLNVKELEKRYYIQLQEKNELEIKMN